MTSQDVRELDDMEAAKVVSLLAKVFRRSSYLIRCESRLALPRDEGVLSCFCNKF